jgi:dTDP-4-dehydrorhamnose reductase
VLVLGSTGMLGSTVTKYLSQNVEMHEVFEANRAGISTYSGNKAIVFDAIKQPANALFNKNQNFDFVINCIGLIKQKLTSNLNENVFASIKLNSIFPIDLASASVEFQFKLIQIATDCVYSGSEGKYLESSDRNPTDVYGYTKALGEVVNENLLTLRCSIIGKEVNSSKSLMDWLLSHPRGASIDGYSNHFWNGLTTLHFAKICSGIIQTNFLSGTFHLIPNDQISKFELLKIVAASFARSDLQITSTEAPKSINRTLATEKMSAILKLWSAAGYQALPDIQFMVEEFADWHSAT